MRRLKLRAIFAIGLTVLSACSQETGYKAAEQAVPGAERDSHATRRNGTSLAYKHSVVIETTEARVAEGVENIAKACNDDTENECVVLARSIATGESPFGSVRLRISQKGIEPIVLIAASVGSIKRRETEAEDLADAIADTESRLRMLVAYRERLEQLQSDANANVDAQIKVASELSEVQSRIERATTDAANQKKRIETELLKIDVVVNETAPDSTAIKDAFQGFTGELAQGIAAAITGLAYVVPWFVVLLPFFFLIRRMWRGRRSK